MGCGCVNLTAGGLRWARQVLELDWSPNETEFFVTRARAPPHPGVEHESFAPRPSCGLGAVRFSRTGGLFRRPECSVSPGTDTPSTASSSRGGARGDAERGGCVARAA